MSQNAERKKSQKTTDASHDDVTVQVEESLEESLLQETPVTGDQPKKTLHHHHARRSKVTPWMFTALTIIVAGNIYYHYQTSQELEALKATYAGRQGEGNDLKFKALESQLKEQLGEVHPKVALLSEKVESLSAAAASSQSPVKITDEQLDQIVAYLDKLKKDDPSGKTLASDEVKSIKGLILMQVLQQLIQNGQPYAMVLGDLRKVFEDRQWMTSDLTVSFDILNIAAKEGLTPTKLLHDIPHVEQTVAWPSFLKWLSHFVHVESVGGSDLSRAQKQTLSAFLDHRQFDEAVALIKRHLDQHPNLPQEQRDSWITWTKSVELHLKTQQSLTHVQHALIEKGLSHVATA